MYPPVQLRPPVDRVTHLSGRRPAAEATRRRPLLRPSRPVGSADVTDRDDLLAMIKQLAVVRGDVILSSGQHADWYIDLRRLLLDGQAAPKQDSFTGDQQFFIAFGQNWGSKTREASLRQQIVGDPHSPAEYRADTVRNIDAWYAAFDVKPGEKLYLAPPDRVRIW